MLKLAIMMPTDSFTAVFLFSFGKTIRAVLIPGLDTAAIINVFPIYLAAKFPMTGINGITG